MILAYGVPEAQFQIWSYKGSSKLDAAEALGGFIREVSNTTKVIVHRDSDYLLDEDVTRLRLQYTRANLTLFVTPGVDVEGLFCRKEHLKAMNPGDELLVDAAYATAIASCSAELKAKAKEGAKQVDGYRFRNGLATRGEAERANWLDALDITSERWMHGKTCLSAIRKAFQDQNGRNLKNTSPSAHLKFPELTAILQPAVVAAEPVVVAAVPTVVATAAPAAPTAS